MKQKSILFPCLLLAASVYAWLESGQADLFSGQDQWPVLLMLLGAAFVYQGKKEAVTPHFFIGLLLFGIGLHFFAKPKWMWWPDDFETLLFMIGFSLLVSTVQKKEYVYEAVSMICFSLFLYFFKQIMAWLESANIPTALLKEYWPFVFIGISLLLLLMKRKKSIR
ncbi:hypothetical protein [Bacillus sp. MSP13]|uniref:hypothetical protein n=1 Tax=Bacillus sp. MSP13 TaxID=1071061 RepID=UPI00057C1782|nr:hypothetical protein [Bacillus sp. MSP13]